jgi:hypothetical protein
LYHSYEQFCSSGGLGSIYNKYYYKLLESQTPFIIDSLCGSDSVLISYQLLNGIPPYNFKWFENNILIDSLSLSNVFFIPDTTLLVMTVYDSEENISIDSFEIRTRTPSVNLGNDTILFCGENFLLIPDYLVSNSYLWPDASTDSIFNVSISGDYWVEVTDSSGCINSDTVSVVINEAPMVNLGNDTLICTDQNLILNAGSGYSSYYWQDGSTDSTFIAISQNSGGDTLGYHVWVTDTNGCEVRDSILIVFEVCNFINKIPSIKCDISPNPVKAGSILNIRMNTGSSFNLHVYDVTGAMRIDEYSLSVSATVLLRNFESGVYFYRIELSSGDVILGKFSVYN